MEPKGEFQIEPMRILDKKVIMLVGARTLMVLRMGNSAELREIVSGVMTQNSLRVVGVE